MQGRGAPGKRLYAIGDVHGCHAELKALLARIEADHRARPARPCHIVMLGDLIDRGPDSRGVINLLRHHRPDFARFHFIKGNHEDSLVRCLTGAPREIPAWLSHGGRACAMSYGVDPSLLYSRDTAYLEQVLLSAIPEGDITFMEACLDSITFGTYLLVHAGVRPGVELQAQTAQDKRWIREPFLSSEADHGAVIVHGHSIHEDVVIRPNRVGVDTGAYMNGRLSAVRLEEYEIGIISTQ